MWRRDIALLLLGALCGPPLASVCFLLASGIGRHGLASLQAFDLAFVTATLPFAYLFAFVPSLIAAGSNALVGRWTASQPIRLALSLPIGAIPFMLSLSWLAEGENGGPFSVPDLAGLGIAGALVSLIGVAAVDSFGAARERH